MPTRLLMPLTLLTLFAALTALAARPPDRGPVLSVRDGRLIDSNGQEFRIRGVNRLHWDSDSAAGIVRSHANTERWTIDFNRPAAQNIALVRAQSIREGIVPIVGNWGGTCSPDPNKLSAMVDTWVAQARQWTRLNHWLIVNIANEWGPADSTVWRDAYIRAVGRLRAAGYRGPILIDSGGCGQDDADLLRYSQAVFDSDPERDVLFALHLYGGANDYAAAIRSVQRGNPTIVTLASEASGHPFAPGFNGSNNSYSGITAYQISGVRGMTQLDGTQPARQNVGGHPGAWTVTLTVDSGHWGDYAGGGALIDYHGNYALRIARLAALSRRTGAAYIVGEFGPGRNVGPSPTLVTARQIMTAAQANGIGWLAWAWDDNDLAGGASDDHWFSMTYHGPGLYSRPADLTEFGREVVLDPMYGLQALARPAALFGRR